MSDKKHIDRLFQEKLKDFEATPTDAVWDKIHDRLHKEERKRRVIPIWWRVAGVAALLALLFTVGINLMPNDFDSSKPTPVVDTETQSADKTKGTIVENSNIIENQIDNASNVATENDTNSEDGYNGNLNESGTDGNKNNNSISNNNTSEKNRANQKMTKVPNSAKNRIANNDKADSNGNGSHDKLNNEVMSNRSSKENKTNTTKDAVVNVSKADEDNSKPNNSSQNNLDIMKEKSVMDKLIKDSKNDADSKVTDATEKIENIVSEEKKEDDKTDKSIEEAIAEANTEDKKEEERKLNRWNISPNVAPVYFNSLGKGSTLDAQFVDNKNTSEVTMSYGLGGSYAINDRIKVRAGINKVDMDYSTNNIIAFRTIDESRQAKGKLDNVNTNANANDLTFMSTETLDRNNTPDIINSKSQGSIDQRFGFIEVPLEMEYAVINKKLGVNVIGGFSTLIVDKNEIYSVVNGTETRIGEANNINNMSYSANLGLGINYHVSEKIKVNVEPTFKYQINTFDNSSGDFQPYFIGVYTGLSYKF